MSNGVNPGPYIDNRTDAQKNISDRKHTGQYIKSITIAAESTLICTGSNAGYNTVFLSSGDGPASVVLTGGTTFTLPIHPEGLSMYYDNLSIYSVQNSGAENTLQLLKKVL